MDVASLYELKCPNCGAAEYIVLGTNVKGRRNAMIAGVAGGAIGGAIGMARMFKGYTEGPIDGRNINYKCKKCKTVFEGGPFQAADENILEKPCMITFNRLGAAYGCAVEYYIYLNGIWAAIVRNKQSVAFPTYSKYNTLFVMVVNGKPMEKEPLLIMAESGSEMVLNYKNGFRG